MLVARVRFSCQIRDLRTKRGNTGEEENESLHDG
jgi:hypothetical protein